MKIHIVIGSWRKMSACDITRVCVCIPVALRTCFQISRGEILTPLKSGATLPVISLALGFHRRRLESEKCLFEPLPFKGKEISLGVHLWSLILSLTLRNILQSLKRPARPLAACPVLQRRRNHEHRVLCLQLTGRSWTRLADGLCGGCLMYGAAQLMLCTPEPPRPCLFCSRWSRCTKGFLVRAGQVCVNPDLLERPGDVSFSYFFWNVQYFFFNSWDIVIDLTQLLLQKLHDLAHKFTLLPKAEKVLSIALFLVAFGMSLLFKW